MNKQNADKIPSDLIDWLLETTSTYEEPSITDPFKVSTTTVRTCMVQKTIPDFFHREEKSSTSVNASSTATTRSDSMLNEVNKRLID